MVSIYQINDTMKKKCVFEKAKFTDKYPYVMNKVSFVHYIINSRGNTSCKDL